MWKRIKKKCGKEYLVGLRGPPGPVGPSGSTNIITTLISSQLSNIDSNSNLILNSSTNQINTIIKDVTVDKTNIFKYLPLDTGLNGLCDTIAFEPDGNLYAGGFFTNAGSIIVNNIAKWDGSTWSALDTGLNGRCNTIAFGPDDNLYAGGFFNAEVVAVNNIAKWNGTTWSALGTGLNRECTIIAFDPDGNLYACGNFTNVGGITVNFITNYSNDYVNLLVNSNLVDTISLRQTKIILISNDSGYSLTFK